MTQSNTYRDRNYDLLGSEQIVRSDDGLTVTTTRDIQGDKIADYVTEQTTIYEADGDVQNSVTTVDGTGSIIMRFTSHTTGNGLITNSTIDLGDDGSIDRTFNRTEIATGGSTETTKIYNLQNELLTTSVTTVSADGWTTTRKNDLDGDGFIDTESVSSVDVNRTNTTVSNDLNNDGTVAAKITSVQANNGLSASTTFDFTNDGSVDLTRTRSVAHQADGKTVVTNIEKYGTADAYRSVATTTANGLQTTTQIDVNGDGSFDETSIAQTQYLGDGSTVSSVETLYADGSLRYKSLNTTSADGLKTEYKSDRDGNGVVDHQVTEIINADGSRSTINLILNKAGVVISKSVTEVSADGLTETVTANGNRETYRYSATSDESYTWENGVAAAVGSTNIKSSHTIDGNGVDTWICTMTTMIVAQRTVTFGGQQNGGSYIEYYNQSVTTTKTVVLDNIAKEQLFAVAGQIYDAILDRDMGRSEYEVLINSIKDGALDETGFATSLMGEFDLRYGALSNAEYVNQIYINAFGRDASMFEVDLALRRLTLKAETRVQFALDISNNIEHLFVGNNHRSTNNIDLDIVPPVFERGLDAAEARELVSNLIDVIYDRDATAHELETLTKRLLTGTENLDDLASLLLQDDGQVQGVATRGLKGLTDAALVDLAFLNALGRLPTADEKRDWGDNLSAGRLSVAQFAALLATSTEHQAIGNSHNVGSAVPLSLITGTAAAETLTGTAGSETLTGGLGADTINDAGGHDVYVWKKGDGNDTIYDQSASLVQTDTLLLLDVLPSEVSLSHISGGSNLIIKIGLETITITNRYYAPSTGYGLEQIQFADGTVWALDKILSESKLVGTAIAETIAATNMRDIIEGLDGNDTIYSYAGDDHVSGGLGVDLINDNGGNDVYVWKKGDGSDTIYDSSADQNELDLLHLIDATQSEVSLVRIGNDLKVKIGANEVITFTNGASTVGYGIEQIKFSDGSFWTWGDIKAKTKTEGTAGVDGHSYTAQDDVIWGYAGNDSLDGWYGNDRIIGGTGVDYISDGSGNETFVWSKNDGNDTIYDSSASLIEIDTLELTNVASGEAVLTRANNSADLQIKIGLETLTLTNQYYTSTAGYGVERIVFVDGVAWTLNDIWERTSINGTTAADTLYGRDHVDNIFGGAGNDVIYGYGGNDLIVGGIGNDAVYDTAGHDTYRWSTGDGSDTIYDQGALQR